MNMVGEVEGRVRRFGKAEPSVAPILSRPSHRILFWFAVYLRWYIGRHFHAVRLAYSQRFPATTGPLIVYSNHASWWDPVTFLVMSRHLLPEGHHYAPMEAQALRHYGFFRKLGIFPVESGTPRGAAQFLRAASQIFSIPGSVLWLTPEGRFSDVRTRPAVFRPGMAAMVARLAPCTLVPLASEYTFWEERLPEVLMACGKPIHVTDGRAHTTAEWNEILATALVNTQDELAALAKQRDPAVFTTVLAGRLGISGVYGGWQRLRAFFHGRAYSGSHAQVVMKTADE